MVENGNPLKIPIILISSRGSGILLLLYRFSASTKGGAVFLGISKPITLRHSSAPRLRCGFVRCIEESGAEGQRDAWPDDQSSRPAGTVESLVAGKCQQVDLHRIHINGYAPVVCAASTRKRISCSLAIRSGSPIALKSRGESRRSKPGSRKRIRSFFMPPLSLDVCIYMQV